MFVPQNLGNFGSFHLSEVAGDDVGTRCRPLAKHALSAASVGFWLLIPLSCMPET